MKQRNYVVEEHDKPMGSAGNERGERTWHVKATDEMDARIKCALRHGLDATMLKVVTHD